MVEVEVRIEFAGRKGNTRSLGIADKDSESARNVGPGAYGEHPSNSGTVQYR